LLSDEESKARFEAALRGARAAAPHPMKDIPPKRRKGVAGAPAKKKVRARRKAKDAPK
jgi:hypothetical protein